MQTEVVIRHSHLLPLVSLVEQGIWNPDSGCQPLETQNWGTARISVCMYTVLFAGTLGTVALYAATLCLELLFKGSDFRI